MDIDSAEPSYLEADFEIQFSTHLQIEDPTNVKEWCARPHDWDGLVKTL